MFRWLKRILFGRKDTIELQLSNEDKYVSVHIMDLNKPNKNGRVYPRETLMSDMQAPIVQVTQEQLIDDCNCDECASTIKCNTNKLKNGSIKNRY